MVIINFSEFDLKNLILFEILVTGIIIFVFSILNPKQSEPNESVDAKHFASHPWETNEEVRNFFPRSWEINEKVTNFLTAKNFLISHYINIASAQAVRFIGFTAGVFTFIGATQINSEQVLHKIMPAIDFDTSSLFFLQSNCCFSLFLFSVYSFLCSEQFFAMQHMQT